MKKTPLLFIAAVSISLIVFFYQSYSTIKHRSQSLDDQQITTLVQKINYPQEQDFQKILAKRKITNTFSAKYNNLGTIAFLFNNYQKINSDWVWFRIKEKDSIDWYYQNKYNTNQFNPEYYFTFGFPIITDSQNKEYLVEIESMYGEPTNSISLHSKSENYIAKYSYPKSYLLENHSQILPLIINKIQTYLSYIPKIEIGKIVIKSSLPLLIYLLIILKPLKYFKYFERLRSNSKIKIFFDTHNVRIIRFFNIFNPIIIFLITLIIAGYFSTIGADPHHDGILFKPAIDLATGKILFKESFTQYGALTTMIQALALKIFGSNLITIKLLTAFFYALISVLLYFISKRFLPKSILFTSLLIWLFTAPYYLVTFLPWSSVYALFFQLLTIYLFIIFFEKKSLKYLILASVSTALIFWCRQPVGVFTFLAIVFYFIYLYFTKQIKYKTFDRYLSHFIIVNFLISLIFILYFTLNHSVIDWWKQSILLTFIWGENTSNGFDISKTIYSLLPTSNSSLSIWALIPISTILLLITNHKNKLLLLPIFVGLASWLQYYPVADIRHQYWAATPMIPLFCLFIYQLCQRFIFSNFNLTKNVVKLFTILIIIIIFLPDLSNHIKQGIIKINTNYQYVEQPAVLKGIKLNPAEAEYYQYMSQKITDYFQKNPQGNVITNGPNALYLTFDSRIKNIHPMYVYWPMVSNAFYPNYISTQNNYLEKEKPLFISFWDQIPAGYCRLDDKSNYDTASLTKPCN